MPIGRVVLARITKVQDNGARFDCSLRKSLIVYGVHQVQKKDLQPSTRINCLILATSADGVSFGQVKGSYHKLKIKGTPEGASAGQLCLVELTKIEMSKITANFIEFADDSYDRDGAEQERHFAKVFASVQEEARHDIIAAKLEAKVKKENPETA